MIDATIKTYRNAYSGLSRPAWMLSLVMLINRSGTMVIPFMMIYLTSPQMGYSIGLAGIVVGLFGAGAFAGAFFGGKLTDKIGFYPVQLITLFGGGILFMLLGQMKSYPFICIFTFLLSFVNEAFRPANSTAIAFYSTPENRTRSYALNRLAINIGWGIGSGLGGLVAEFSFELLFWIDGITNVLAAILMWLFLTAPEPVLAEERKKETVAVVRSAYRDKVYLWFIVVTTLFAGCFFQIFTNLGAFFSNELHFSKSYIGFIMAMNGVIIALVEMILIYKLEGRRRNTAYIVFGVTLTGLAFLMLNIPGTGPVMAFTVIVLITFGEIFALPFMNTYWIARTEHSNRGQYAALYTMAWSAAQSLGPLLAAQLAQYAGFAVVWWVVGGLCLLSAYGFWVLHKATR